MTGLSGGCHQLHFVSKAFHTASTGARVLSSKKGLKTLIPTVQRSYFVWLYWIEALCKCKATNPTTRVASGGDHEEAKEIKFPHLPFDLERVVSLPLAPILLQRSAYSSSPPHLPPSPPPHAPDPGRAPSTLPTAAPPSPLSLSPHLRRMWWPQRRMSWSMQT